MTSYRIPFNRPAYIGNELQYIQRSLEMGHISGDGYFTKKCQELLEQELGVNFIRLTTSCTHALEMSALLLDIGPGDEVIIPSFTFVSTVNAFVLRGARPVFADIRPDTLNIDEAQLEALISERTRAIVPVHYAGVGCAMDKILHLADANGIHVVEDNAHGLFGKYRGKYLGTFGAIATQSFHETKNFTCGEGGAIIVNDASLEERAEIIREKGTDRSRFFRGLVDKYTWVDMGSSYLPSDLLAAYLHVQLENRDAIQAKRQQIWETYYSGLEEWAKQHSVRLPTVPEDCQQSFHMFYLILPDNRTRQALMDWLKVRGILSVFHYQSLHLSKMGRRYGYEPGDCPVTEAMSDRLLRLPFYYNLEMEEQHSVIAAILQFTEG